MAQENDKRGKQRSIKQAHKTKDRVTRTPLRTRGELRCNTICALSQQLHNPIENTV